MNAATKPYVQFSNNEVPVVAHDPEGRHDPDRCDRYATFEEARDAALSIIELTLDAADYDDEAHREELETMQGLLESAATFDGLAEHPRYAPWLAARTAPALAVA